jgi:hypothetical protein
MTLNMILRMLAALALMAVLFFCVFGCLASYEYSEVSRRLPSQIAYGAIGLACAAGVFRLMSVPSGLIGSVLGVAIAFAIRRWRNPTS